MHIVTGISPKRGGVPTKRVRWREHRHDGRQRSHLGAGRARALAQDSGRYASFRSLDCLVPEASSRLEGLGAPGACKRVLVQYVPAAFGQKP